MRKPIYEIMYRIYKDEVDTKHSVGVLYTNNKTEKINRLMADYPESKGYKLVLMYDRLKGYVE